MIIRLLMFPFLLICCTISESKQNQNSTTLVVNYDADTDGPFDFHNPDATYVMDYKLQEISGLAYDSNTKQFLTHNDEYGHIHTLDKNFDYKVSEKWAKKGDYEAIETDDNNVYFLKSNGTILICNKAEKTMDSHKTQLKTKNETEGLCFDYKSKNILLLACKGLPLKKPGEEMNTADKCVYAYNLSTKTLDPNPFLTISDASLLEYSQHKEKEGNNSRYKLGKNVKNFAPSGVAVDPMTGDYYIISAKESLVAIYDTNKKLKTLASFNKKIMPQPEGITFDESGHLYIATEGKSKSGKVFKFNRH